MSYAAPHEPRHVCHCPAPGCNATVEHPCDASGRPDKGFIPCTARCDFCGVEHLFHCDADNGVFIGCDTIMLVDKQARACTSRGCRKCITMCPTCSDAICPNCRERKDFVAQCAACRAPVHVAAFCSVVHDRERYCDPCAKDKGILKGE